MLDNAAIGLYIRRLRKKRNQKQVDLANYLGIDRTAFCKGEKGERAFTALEIAKLEMLWGESIISSLTLQEKGLNADLFELNQARQELELIRTQKIGLKGEVLALLTLANELYTEGQISSGRYRETVNLALSYVEETV